MKLFLLITYDRNMFFCNDFKYNYNLKFKNFYKKRIKNIYYLVN